MRIYLAGPINGCTDEEANGWRDGFQKRLPHAEFLDPMVRDYRGREDECYEEIVAADLVDISNSDVFLAYCWQPSWGTGQEMVYAYEAGCEVVVVLPEGQRVSPWLRYHSNVILHTLQHAAAYITSLMVESGELT